MLKSGHSRHENEILLARKWLQILSCGRSPLLQKSLIQHRWVLTDLISNRSGFSSMMNVISGVYEEWTKKNQWNTEDVTFLDVCYRGLACSHPSKYLCSIRKRTGLILAWYLARIAWGPQGPSGAISISLDVLFKCDQKDLKTKEFWGEPTAERD